VQLVLYSSIAGFPVRVMHPPRAQRLAQCLNATLLTRCPHKIEPLRARVQCIVHPVPCANVAALTGLLVCI
jgi:hypothetical protein